MIEAGFKKRSLVSSMRPGIRRSNGLEMGAWRSVSKITDVEAVVYGRVIFILLAPLTRTSWMVLLSSIGDILAGGKSVSVGE